MERMFSIIPNKDEKFYNGLKSEYRKFLEIDTYKDSMRNFHPFLLSQGQKYDLDFFLLILGTARVSKSTLALHKAIRFYSSKWKTTFDETCRKLIQNGWVFDKIIYSKEQGLAPIKDCKGEFILLDDAVLIADSREAMDPQQIRFIKYLNWYASNNNVICALIQDLTDLDKRIYSKANNIDVVYQRGGSLLYARSKNFPIIKSTYDFERFAKAPYLLNSEHQGLYNMRALSSYIKDEFYPDLSGNLLYETYLKNKQKYQAQGI